jgi:hypothetical protein
MHFSAVFKYVFTMIFSNLSRRSVNKNVKSLVVFMLSPISSVSFYREFGKGYKWLLVGGKGGF